MGYRLLAVVPMVLLVMIPQQILADGAAPHSSYKMATIKLDEAQYFTKSMFHCFDIDELCAHRPQDERKKVTVTITDPDENRFEASIDRVRVFAQSDTYPQGITVTAYETHVNSGVFEGTFMISDTASQGRLLVSDGDSISATYADATTPPDAGTHQVTTGAFIGLLGYPAERAPIHNLKIIGKDGQKIQAVGVDEQVQIITELKSVTSANQPFSYVVQISDQKSAVVYLSWLSGTLMPKQHIVPALSWTPQATGKYTVTAYVWEGMQNPTALSAPLAMDLVVTPFAIKYHTAHSNLTLE